ncbi:choline-binding transcriptional repressor BetI [Rubrimonas cliftonensis]|uniref:HTH-type transcriptional regulator BetI n=1 Tax=Rubrimonas cliftonensis TaxID=89524 RepID=A0A1H3WVE4_9RHOB|nr:transcriptional regulator BetI [Rubrimonas cliftonensis]SDZ91109.1 transcriptional regulator, TetR family [Rubrimonas cliftonensis]
MPRIGMKPIRRASLVEAAIAEIGDSGSLNVTVSRIAQRAGVSSALAHHYFGTKESILLSAMRHILSVYSADVRAALAGAADHRGRVEAVVRASFAPEQFRPAVISAWLMFYVGAQRSPETARLLAIYKRRLRSNLLAGLRPLVGREAELAAEGVAALIDGLYIRQSLARGAPPDSAEATAVVLDYVNRVLGSRP